MNHVSAAPPIPRLNRSLMSFSCCTLSKAFDISSIATAVYFFFDFASCQRFVAKIRASSVECCFLYANWLVGYKPFVDKKSVSCSLTKYSSILDAIGSKDTGR